MPLWSSWLIPDTWVLFQNLILHLTLWPWSDHHKKKREKRKVVQCQSLLNQMCASHSESCPSKHSLHYLCDEMGKHKCERERERHEAGCKWGSCWDDWLLSGEGAWERSWEEDSDRWRRVGCFRRSKAALFPLLCFCVLPGQMESHSHDSTRLSQESLKIIGFHLRLYWFTLNYSVNISILYLNISVCTVTVYYCLFLCMLHLKRNILVCTFMYLSFY